jgi:hypothetical protein
MTPKIRMTKRLDNIVKDQVVLPKYLTKDQVERLISLLVDAAKVERDVVKVIVQILDQNNCLSPRVITPLLMTLLEPMSCEPTPILAEIWNHRIIQGALNVSKGYRGRFNFNSGIPRIPVISFSEDQEFIDQSKTFPEQVEKKVKNIVKNSMKVNKPKMKVIAKMIDVETQRIWEEENKVGYGHTAPQTRERAVREEQQRKENRGKRKAK